MLQFENLIWSVLIAVLLKEAVSQETVTQASLLGPRNFNYHPYQIRQFLEETKPTKQGPVLFPNNGPPPPKRPFIVTSRPITESITRSDVNQNPLNNSIAEPTQATNFVFSPVFPLLNPTEVAFLPGIISVPKSAAINNIPQASSYDRIPYADMLKKAQLNGLVRQNGYDDYEIRTMLPPVYKALEDHANQNVLKYTTPTQAIPYEYNSYQPQNFDYGNQYGNNDQQNQNNNLDYDQNQNYAFSYIVRDHKTGDDFSHKQQSVSGGTNGEYRVRLPDGRTQIVSYTADESGYKANVRYDDSNNGVAAHNDVHNSNQYTDQHSSNNNFNNINSKNNNQNARNGYGDRYYKEIIPIKEDPNQYNSKEYYDYSSEYNQNYEPYNSKFSIYKPHSTPFVSTVRPTYVEIKDLFTVAPTKSTIIYTDGIVSSTNSPPIYDSSTENAILIGGKKLYANSNNNILTTSSPTQNLFLAVTPASYLASTIASLRERITAKPILSNDFLNRINQYLKFK